MNRNIIRQSSLFTTALFISLGLMMSSCKTTEKFTIYAPSGTKIQAPDMTDIGTENESGFKITAPSNDYFGFIVASDPSNSITAPFGLNIHKKVRHGEKAAVGTGFALSSVGLGAVMTSTIAMLAANSNGNEDMTSSFGLVSGAGCAVASIGAAIGLPANSRLHQLTHTYNFTYDSKQHISFEGLSPILLHLDKPKDVSIQESSQPRRKAISGEQNQTTTENTTTAKRKRNNIAKNVVGTYNGTGKLMEGKSIEETYNSIQLNIEEIDGSTVNIRIIESNEDFFYEPLKFNVTTVKNGGYLLSLESIPSVKIEIDKKGRAKFFHDKVNIEGTIYSLTIDASR